MKRLLAVLLVVAMCLCLIPACGEEEPPKVENNVLSVAYTSFGGKFSPFYAELPADRDIVAMTQLSLLSTDRAGNVILGGIHGETTEYNGTSYTYTGPADVMVIAAQDGTVSYEFTLREDLCFSDGTPLTADDVIFSMYVLCDPMYRGSSDFASLPIEGLSEYRTGMVPKWELILKDTPKNAAEGSPEGHYTAEEAQSFWVAFNRVGEAFAQYVVEDLVSHELATDVHTAAAFLGFDSVAEGAANVDLFHAIVDEYGYDLDRIDTLQRTRSFKELLLASLDASLFVGIVRTQSANEITGIQKMGTYSLRVVLSQADVTALSHLCIPIAPLHYYGKRELYNERERTFGFPKGDLTSVMSKTGTPMGAGAYKFVRYNDGIVSFKANERYYCGVPSVEEVLFKKVSELQKVERLSGDVVDLTMVELSKTTVAEIEKINGGVLGGDRLTAKIEGDGRYGYIGISADGVKVGEDPASEQSKYLRKAFATMFTYYRQVSLERHYGERASTLGYPFTGKVPFTTDIRGRELELRESMTPEERRDIVMGAVLNYLRAAGYTVKNGKVTKAPAGASLSYDLWFSGGGKLESPVYLTMAYTRNAWEELGLTLTLYDRVTPGEVEEAIRNERAKIWYVEREAITDTDIYSACFSSPNAYLAGADNYRTEIRDEELNRLLIQLRRESDESARLTLYQKCYDIIEAWGVEVPICVPKQALVFKNDSVRPDTVARDITPYYSWIREIEKLEMAG